MVGLVRRPAQQVLRDAAELHNKPLFGGDREGLDTPFQETAPGNAHRRGRPGSRLSGTM
jgi:hypothetical protein